MNIRTKQRIESAFDVTFPSPKDPNITKTRQVACKLHADTVYSSTDAGTQELCERLVRLDLAVAVEETGLPIEPVRPFPR